MMLNSFVIIPDCVGNRSYSEHQKSCILSSYDTNGFKSSLLNVLSKSVEEFESILKYAKESTQQYSMEIESNSLYEALMKTKKLWST